MAGKQLSDGNPTGTTLGKDETTDKVAFFGGTPAVQPIISAVGTATATTTLNETKIDRLYVALLAINLINTGG
jgi:hypothetical protein